MSGSGEHRKESGLTREDLKKIRRSGSGSKGYRNNRTRGGVSKGGKRR